MANLAKIWGMDIADISKVWGKDKKDIASIGGLTLYSSANVSLHFFHGPSTTFSPYHDTDTIKYDDVGDSWTTLTDTSLDEQNNWRGEAADNVNNYRYLVAGNAAQPANNYNVNNKQWDVQSDSWSEKNDKSSGGHDYGCISQISDVDQKFIHALPATGGGSPSAYSDEYDCVGDTWTVLANWPSGTRMYSDGGGCPSDDKLARGGGWTGSVYTTDHRVYDRSADSWTDKTDKPQNSTGGSGPEHRHNGDDKYTLCCQRTGGSGVPLSDTDEYDFFSDSWATKTDQPSSYVYETGFSAFDGGGDAWFIHGCVSGGTHVQQSRTYNADSDSWSSGSSSAINRYFKSGGACGL